MPTIEEALVAFERQAKANGRSQHSINQTRRHVRRLAAWLATEGRSLDVAELDPGTVAEFMGSPMAANRVDGRRKLATSTNALRSSLRGFCAFVHASDLAPANAARLLRRAMVGDAPPRALSQAEEERLLGVLGAASGPEAHRDRMAFLLMLRCGLRLGSVVALDAADCDLDAGVLAVRVKGDRRERVHLPREVRQELEGFLAGRGDGAIFTSHSGRRLTARHIQRRFVVAREKAGLSARVGCHSLRHSFATGLLRKTGNVELVRRALNHRSASSTAIYLRVEDGELREALGA